MGRRIPQRIMCAKLFGGTCRVILVASVKARNAPPNPPEPNPRPGAVCPAIRACEEKTNGTPPPPTATADHQHRRHDRGGRGAARAGRLRNGELRQQVAAYLAAHPGAHTAGQIARGLSGRSAGAVANALQILLARGQAALATTTPARYTATPATAAAATPPSRPAPPPAATASPPRRRRRRATPRPRRPRAATTPAATAARQQPHTASTGAGPAARARRCRGRCAARAGSSTTRAWCPGCRT